MGEVNAGRRPFAYGFVSPPARVANAGKMLSAE